MVKMGIPPDLSLKGVRVIEILFVLSESLECLIIVYKRLAHFSNHFLLILIFIFPYTKMGGILDPIGGCTMYRCLTKIYSFY